MAEQVNNANETDNKNGSLTNIKITDQTLEPKKEVQNFKWHIKEFLALWEMGKERSSNIKNIFEIGHTIDLPTTLIIFVNAPNIQNHEEEDGPIDYKNVALYFRQINIPRSRRHTDISCTAKILRSDGSTYKEIGEKTPMDFVEMDFEGYTHNITLGEVSELKNAENKILEDGSLTIELEVTLYSSQVRKYTKRSYDAAELEKKSAESLAEDFESMRKKQKYMDVTFITNDEKCLRAHKSVVAARSEVFEAMFESDFIEGKSGIVKLEDLSYEPLEILIKFMYTGKLDEAWLKYADEVINAAEKYKIKLIKQLGDKDLIKNVDVSNALDMKRFAEIHELPTALDDIHEYIQRNVDKIYPSPKDGNK